MHLNSRQRGWLLVLAVLVAYWPALQAGFVWDDALYLLQNPLIKARDGLWRFWTTTEFTDYYALSNSTFWLEWRLWGNTPTGYHLVNLLLHAANAWLLWRLLERLHVPAAWWAALLFAVHPVNVMSVAWISERKNLLSLLFSVLSLLNFLRWVETRHRRWYGLALGCFALALVSKTAVVMLPLVLLLCLWWQQRRPLTWSDLRAVSPFLALSLLLGLVTIWFENHHGVRLETVRPEGWGSRIAGVGWVLWFYLGKAVWPFRLMAIYPRWQIDPTLLLAWVPLLGVVGLGIGFRKQPAVLFALGVFAIMLLPVWGLFDIGFMAYALVADHWQYAAMPALLALLAAALSRWRIVLGLIAAAFIVLSMQQSKAWHSDETLWRDTIAKNPDAWMAYNNLGNSWLAAGRIPEARAAYAETIRRRPDYANAHYNLGILLFNQGDFAGATEQFRATVRLKPNSAEARNNLGAALTCLGQTNAAVQEFQAACQLAPRWAQPRVNLQRLSTATHDP